MTQNNEQKPVKSSSTRPKNASDRRARTADALRRNLTRRKTPKTKADA
jgi:hypothetical protein